jgi:hypothetical protein
MSVSDVCDFREAGTTAIGHSDLPTKRQKISVAVCGQQGTQALPAPLLVRKRLFGLAGDAGTIFPAPNHPAQPRGGSEHELIGNGVSSRHCELRAAFGNINNGALALDRAANRDLSGNIYRFSRVPAPFGVAPLGVDIAKVRPR